MSAFVNDRDVLIQNTVPRYTVSVDAKEVRLTPSTPVFAVRADGTATIDAITITAELVGITGAVEFTVSPGAALTVDGLVATLRFADMVADVAFVQAKVRDAESNLDFIRSTVISKVFSGPPGDAGVPGQRGTKIIAVSGYSTWSDASAVAELAAAGFGAPINRDVVTLYGPLAEAAEFTMTKFYDGSAWIELGTYINGNLLVQGTVAAEALDVDRLSAIAADLGSITAGSLHAVKIHGGAFTEWNWPADGGIGYYQGPEGMRMGNPSTSRYFDARSNGDLYTPGLTVVNGRASFTGNVNTGTGLGFRIEQGPDDPVYAMWAGAGAKTDANAIFFLKRSGAGYFGGSLSAGTLKTSVSNPTIDPNAQLVDGPFGSNGGVINVVCSFDWLFAQSSNYHRYTAGAGTNTATLTLYRKIGSGAEEVVQTATLSGPTTIANAGLPDEPSTCDQSIQGAFTYTDTAASTENRTYRAVLSLVIQTTVQSPRPGGGAGSAFPDRVYQRLSLATSEG